MRLKEINLLSLLFVLFFVVSAGNAVKNASAQSAGGKWSYFKFKAGQYFKYELKAERGLKGWVSVKVEDGGNGVFNVTLAGKLTAEFSETVRLKPGMSAFDFIYSPKNYEITNAMSNLVDIDTALVDNTTWKEGFKWAQGDKTIEVAGEKEYAGIRGLLVTYSSKLLGKVQRRTYCVNSNLPLPVFAEVPAANGTWTYELVEKRGF
jgi:hypothetical protein